MWAPPNPRLMRLVSEKSDARLSHIRILELPVKRNNPSLCNELFLSSMENFLKLWANLLGSGFNVSEKQFCNWIT